MQIVTKREQGYLYYQQTKQTKSERLQEVTRKHCTLTKVQYTKKIQHVPNDRPKYVKQKLTELEGERQFYKNNWKLWLEQSDQQIRKEIEKLTQ